ncbi:hypothetical protein Cflav_PD3541 [Pedosphaera parvula Ellin514]|uniref:Uncharacterized protein n=1 Tax=Pedosphaera parvula (strain Ellin514) TaxID=320771 RepID=B9XI78_PEDPL|nr:hypothetical protein Cflav_PD3541 [Pedosphaera parvula Ellin514]
MQLRLQMKSKTCYTCSLGTMNVKLFWKSWKNIQKLVCRWPKRLRNPLILMLVGSQPSYLDEFVLNQQSNY